MSSEHSRHFFIIIDLLQERINCPSLLHIEHRVSKNLFKSGSVGFTTLRRLNEGDAEKRFQELSIIQTVLKVKCVFHNCSHTLDLRKRCKQLNYVGGGAGEIGNLQKVEEPLQDYL